jgi:hypothetical protein
MLASKTFREKQYRGYNASKKEYFYGFKAHATCTGAGAPVEFSVTPGSAHDNAAV